MQSPEDSKAQSDLVKEIAEPIIDRIFGPDNDIDVNYLVRKAAHFIEFFLLGVCFSGLFAIIKFYLAKDLVPYSFFCVLLIAVIDEYIQSFTGRTSAVSDVWIDFFGAICGIFFVILARRIYTSVKQKQKHSSDR